MLIEGSVLGLFNGTTNLIYSKYVKTRYPQETAGFENYPSVLIMLEIESNNWLSTSENIECASLRQACSMCALNGIIQAC